PGWFDDIVWSMMEQSPTDRPQSIGRLAEGHQPAEAALGQGGADPRAHKKHIRSKEEVKAMLNGLVGATVALTVAGPWVLCEWIAGDMSGVLTGRALEDGLGFLCALVFFGSWAGAIAGYIIT